MNDAERVSIAMIVAALVPSTPVGVMVFIDQMQHVSREQWGVAFQAAALVWCVGFAVAFLHALSLGLPVYTVIKAHRKVQWWDSVLYGPLVGAAPFAFFYWPVFITSSPDMRAWNGHRMVDYVVAGMPTRAGWVLYGEGILLCAAIGLVSAMIAWIVWRLIPVDVVPERPRWSFKDYP